MKIQDSRISAFLDAPEGHVKSVLIYGPDVGLAQERLARLTKTVCDDPKDPFRVSETTGAALKKDPAWLSDEAAAMSFTGGRRVVRVIAASDANADIFADVLSQSGSDSLIIVTAGELPPRSKLRKLHEDAKNAVSMPCYADEGRKLSAVISQTLLEQGVRVSGDALAYLTAHLGADRLLTRSELDKLALYKGGHGEVSLEEAVAVVGDNGGFAMDDVAFATASGNQAGLDKALARAFHEGLQAISILRMVSRHFQRLHLAVAYVERGESADGAMKKLRPPIFFKNTDTFRAQMNSWNKVKLARALDLLTEAEGDCKVTGMPAEVICSRTLVRLAQAARAR